MRTTFFAIAVLTAAAYTSAAAQNATDQKIAELLSNPGTRVTAVEAVVGARGEKLPLLLSWARKPPVGVEARELYIGLADVFGRLRTADAIPFLIQNISLARTKEMNTWLKAPDAIRDRLPAAAALISIGPRASRAVIHAAWGSMTSEDRLAAFFVVSQVPGVPEANDFLSSSLAELNEQRYWIEEGLKHTTVR